MSTPKLSTNGQLAAREKALGPDHPDVAQSLNNLALLYSSQARYADAEPLVKRSIAILEKTSGPNHPNVAKALNDLAELYRIQGRYADAERIHRAGDIHSTNRSHRRTCRSVADTVRPTALSKLHWDLANPACPTQ